jgi:hypothetical protein
VAIDDAAPRSQDTWWGVHACPGTEATSDRKGATSGVGGSRALPGTRRLGPDSVRAAPRPRSRPSR